MIEIRVQPSGVEKVVLVSASAEDEDLDLQAWKSIRELVERIDLTLRWGFDDLTSEPPAAGGAQR